MNSKNTQNRTLPISKEDRQVYDRQIRLWGYGGQYELSNLNVLVIGMQGLGAEVAKNLILAGVGSITLKDHTDVQDSDNGSQILIPNNNEKINRAKANLLNAQDLNRNVKVLIDTTPIEENNDTFISLFHVIIATDCSPQTYKKLNEDCRKLKVMLFIGDVYGLFGFFVQDVNFHHSLFGDIFPNTDQNHIVPFKKYKSQSYYLAAALLKFQNDFNRKPDLQNYYEDIKLLNYILSTLGKNVIDIDNFDKKYEDLFYEPSPTISIIGRILANTAISTLQGNASKKYNVVFFNKVTAEATYYLL